MIRLTERSLGPPGGWKYTQPESGLAFRAVTYGQLLEFVRNHRKGNKYDVSPGWEERFEEEFCTQNRLIGTPWCLIENTEPKMARPWGVADVRRFLNSAAAIAREGKAAFVEQETAETRAEVCANCPFNATLPGCFGCNNLTELIAKIRGSRTTSRDSKLRHCMVCGCVNSVKVWLKDSVVDSTGLEFPDHCWLKKAEHHTEQGQAPLPPVQD